MTTGHIKKTYSWLWITVVFFIIAIGVGIKAFYLGFLLSKTTHPTKSYKIVISKIPSFFDWQTGTPGDSGNSRIVVRLYDANGNKLHEVRTTLNDLSSTMWIDDAAIITTDIVWSLPDKPQENNAGS
jgi:hypothetical protein